MAEPTTMLVVHACVACVCNYSGLSLGFLPAPLLRMLQSPQHRCYIAVKELLRLWGFDRNQYYITSDGARYRDCNTEKDVLSGLYLYNLGRLMIVLVIGNRE